MRAGQHGQWPRRRGRVQRLALGLAFRGGRADYYDYLSALLIQADGRKSLRDIFEDDARRHGTASVRGRLCAIWAERYREHGGDLAATFEGSLPRDDLALVRAAQLAGANALGSALADVAATVRLLEQGARGFASAMAAAVLAMGVLCALLLAVPHFTVPTLRATFETVPPAFWGPRAVALFELAAWLRSGLPAVLAAIVLAGCAVAWSFGGLTGRVRTVLDRCSVWRVYRDFHCVRFLALLSTMLRQRGNVGTSLRNALLAQVPGANAWKSWHLNRMLERVDDGLVGAETFATGLLERSTGWFLADMIAIHGVDQGLARTRERIESTVLRHLLRRAAVLRWAMLLAAVGGTLAMVGWHFAAIDELRRGMQTYYATA
ncbi:general secretion pathway protein [Verticiella sediminum]|uniref:General secretion pathway protein n=1 Tax=Verticiella sediminum TaxID=1247510 RepID=A0A556AVU2_9BURK|nr:general secretion pathway protein [Verticiella sediminum]TSH97072.1 general secretion pathway protein [Verticiella sediminum]